MRAQTVPRSRKEHSPTRSMKQTLMMLSLLMLSASSCNAAASPSLRSNANIDANIDANMNTETEGRRQSAIHRVYGAGNAQVRKEVRLLEEESQRSQTGFPSDPDHSVPYDNHPFELKARRRKLQQQNGGNSTTTPPAEDEKSNYKPIRIRFETKALDDRRTELNAARIDFIEKEILPRTAEFWQTTLSVVPVSGSLKVAASELKNRAYCGDSEFTEVPAQHIASGLSNTDLVLYVSGTPSSRFCSGTTLAVAIACNFDQYDRPTAGAINVCLNQINLRQDGTASDAIIQDNVDVLIHEVAHVLGHSSNSYRFFWDAETGEPRTSRPFTTRTVTCVDDVQRTLILPDESTMSFSVGKNGQRYASLVTPRVRAIARNQFDCQTLEGARLENQPTGSGSCTGDHWEEHDYYPEALSGVISPTTNIVSHLTLALMEDSGWYRANYTMGHISPWGLGAGCDFVNEPCLQSDENGNTFIPDYSKGYFCVDKFARGCSPALTHKMACTVIDYFFTQPRVLPDDRFQYYPSEPTLGGPRQADYCPVFGSTFGGSDAEGLACSDPSNGESINIYSEDYGPGSQCIPTTGGDGRCYRTACIKDEMVLKINVRGEWLTCDEDFQRINVRVVAGALPQTLVCPRLTTACPDLFCPFGCAGRGVCNFSNKVNGTVQPKCECFDPEDDSPGCSDSLLPDGAFLDDSSGLFNNLEENFFDPLMAVFVDHPDKWTTASWAWAAGLLTVFLVMMLCVCSTFWPERPVKKAKLPAKKVEPVKPRRPIRAARPHRVIDNTSRQRDPPARRPPSRPRPQIVTNQPQQFQAVGVHRAGGRPVRPPQARPVRLPVSPTRSEF